MRPTKEQLIKRVPSVSGEIADEYLSSLSSGYFEYFYSEQQNEHLVKIANLSSTVPIKAIFTQDDIGRVDCTIISYDFPSVFSIITGILAAKGFEIFSGEIFTYYKRSSSSKSRRDLRRRVKLGPDSQFRRRIIDHFSGEIRKDISFEQWRTDVLDELEYTFSLLEKGGDKNLTDAQSHVNRIVAEELGVLKESKVPKVYPIEINIDLSLPNYTRFIISSKDTPFFLYSLSTALALHQFSIEHVQINTLGDMVEDIIDLVDKDGKRIENTDSLDRLRLSVMLTKQFSYFVDQAPNPYDAVSRFGKLVEDTMKLSKRGKWVQLLSNRRALQDMARLLGTSDYLWEDFIRIHYESLIPILRSHMEPNKFQFTRQDLEKEISVLISEPIFKNQKKEYDRQKKMLNEFKDQKIFQIDLNHILKGLDLEGLSFQLTQLADVFVKTVVDIVYSKLVMRYGVPKTMGGIPVKHSLLGLGKFGGQDLGYGSDIEILFVYGDSGHTDGAISIQNEQFYEILVREINQFILTKQDGIFRIDLRLRPFGKDGPLAVSLDTFCQYYGPKGAAHFFERLALVRLRAICGDARFGRRLIRLRDQFIYTGGEIDLKSLWELRKIQLKDKCKSNVYNAKYSLGASVDVEYTVMLLQILNGKTNKELRTNKLKDALNIMLQSEILTSLEKKSLYEAYDFSRNLINGLRMLRGSAKDLELPALRSDEYDYLARRIGYNKERDLDPAQHLYLDIEMHSALVRGFLRTRFRKRLLPKETIGNAADVVLSRELSQEAKKSILSDIGFLDPEKALKNLLNISSKSKDLTLFARLAVLACDWLTKKSDPDRALNNWERFVSQLSNPTAHFKLVLKQPMRLDVLFDIFSVSQFLSDTLIQNPEEFEWVTALSKLELREERNRLEKELSHINLHSVRNKTWKKALRRFRKKEILRIAIRDISLHVPLQEITSELTQLAEVVIQVSLDRLWRELNLKHDSKLVSLLSEHFCLLAMGKLGGNELNYSSDIDLIALYNHELFKCSGMDVEFVEDIYVNLINRFREDLADYTEDGYVFRVDFRLRPYGQSGPLVTSVSHLLSYYERSASSWEIQALLKARPVAGNWWLGFEFISKSRERLSSWIISSEMVISTIKMNRKAAVSRELLKHREGIDIKHCDGGLRDIEFLIQGIQLLNCKAFPEIVHGNSLISLHSFRKCKLLPDHNINILKDAYVFFRRVEHFLQLLEDRQNYVLPVDKKEIEALSKRLLGRHADQDQFTTTLELILKTVTEIFSNVF